MNIEALRRIFLPELLSGLLVQRNQSITIPEPQFDGRMAVPFGKIVSEGNENQIVRHTNIDHAPRSPFLLLQPTRVCVLDFARGWIEKIALLIPSDIHTIGP